MPKQTSRRGARPDPLRLLRKVHAEKKTKEPLVWIFSASPRGKAGRVLQRVSKNWLQDQHVRSVPKLVRRYGGDAQRAAAEVFLKTRYPDAYKELLKRSKQRRSH